MSNAQLVLEAKRAAYVRRIIGPAFKYGKRGPRKPKSKQIDRSTIRR
jgi:hypothetical protein